MKHSIGPCLLLDGRLRHNGTEDLSYELPHILKRQVSCKVHVEFLKWCMYCFNVIKLTFVVFFVRWLQKWNQWGRFQRRGRETTHHSFLSLCVDTRPCSVWIRWFGVWRQWVTVMWLATDWWLEELSYHASSISPGVGLQKDVWYTFTFKHDLITRRLRDIEVHTLNSLYYVVPFINY